MELPIESVLKGMRLDVAKLQDKLIGIIYDYVQPDAVLYGGTAVWRCFGGGRFSEDIDIYIGKGFSKKFHDAIDENGLTIIWQDKEFPLNMRVSDGTAEVLVEAKEGSYESIMAQYVRTDGTQTTISVLSPAELLVRKMKAYDGRRYIRDIYDMVQLTNYLDSSDQYVRPKLRSFLKSMKSPVDQGILESLVYKGNAAAFAEMVSYLKRWSGEV